MPGECRGIHAFLLPGLKDVDGRDKPGHHVKSGLDQIEKLVPQPQEAVATGLLILNEAPIRSST